MIKSLYQPERDVTLSTTRARSVCAQWRCGVLPLAVETGRFHVISEENRTCHSCEAREVENEMQILFNCSLYHNLRYRLFLKLSADCLDFFPISVEGRLQYVYRESVSVWSVFLRCLPIALEGALCLMCSRAFSVDVRSQ